MRNFRFTLIIAVTFLGYSCGEGAKQNSSSDTENNEVIAEPVSLTYTLLNSYPHDTAAFTQGLEIHDGKFFESI